MYRYQKLTIDPLSDNFNWFEARYGTRGATRERELAVSDPGCPWFSEQEWVMTGVVSSQNLRVFCGVSFHFVDYERSLWQISNQAHLFGIISAISTTSPPPTAAHAPVPPWRVLLFVGGNSSPVPGEGSRCRRAQFFQKTCSGCDVG